MSQTLEPTKTCKDCGNTKPLSAFYKAQTKDGFRSDCKECGKARARIWNKNNQEKRRASYSRFVESNPSKPREYYLRANYNMSTVEYESLLAHQNGVCAMCGKECSTGKRLAVDHDHTTGAVRGLLCTLCNKYKLGSLTRQEINMIHMYLNSPPADEFFGETRFVPDDKIKPRKRRRKNRAISRRRVN